MAVGCSEGPEIRFNRGLPNVTTGAPVRSLFSDMTTADIAQLYRDAQRVRNNGPVRGVNNVCHFNPFPIPVSEEHSDHDCRGENVREPLPRCEPERVAVCGARCVVRCVSHIQPLSLLNIIPLRDIVNP